MNHDFQINLESIERFAKETQNTSLRLEEIINYLIRITSDIPDFFDTPSAHIMQEALLRYLENAKVPCNRLGELSTKISLFNQNYNSIYNSTKESIGDEA